MRTGVYTEKVILSGSTDPQAFFVPKGCRIDGLVFEKRGTQSGTLRIGTGYTQATRETALLEGVAAVTVPGVVYITLPGIEEETTTSVIVSAGTAEEVAKEIAEASYAEWTAAATKDGEKWNVLFTAKAHGDHEDGSHAFLAGDTGLAGAMAVSTAGADAVDAVKHVDEVTVSVTGEVVAGDITIDDEVIPVSAADTVDMIVTKILEAEFDKWVVEETAVDNVLTFTAKVGGSDGGVTVNVSADNVSVIASTIVNGLNAIPAMAEVVTLEKPTGTVSAGAIVIDLNGERLVLALDGEETEEEIAEAIAALPCEGYAIHYDSLVPTIFFTAKIPGKIEAASYSIAYATDAAVEKFALADEFADVTVEDDVVEDVALPTDHQAVKELTFKVGAFSIADRTPLLIKVDTAACLGFLYVSYEKFAW